NAVTGTLAPSMEAVRFPSSYLRAPTRCHLGLSPFVHTTKTFPPDPSRSGGARCSTVTTSVVIAASDFTSATILQSASGALARPFTVYFSGPPHAASIAPASRAASTVTLVVPCIVSSFGLAGTPAGLVAAHPSTTTRRPEGPRLTGSLSHDDESIFTRAV